MAIFTVTNSNDSGAGSLRQAIDDANNSAGADEIIFSSVSGTIVLDGEDGELKIEDSVTIKGPGANNLAISGNNSSRVFDITDDQSDVLLEVSIDGLTITNGSAYDGGGIRNREKLTITNSTISQNIGNSGSDEGGKGGGIDNEGILRIENSTISGNTAFKGGGIFNYSGQITIVNSTISGNTATEQGGGVYNGGYYSTVNITNATISDNSATSGGGLYNYQSTAETFVITNTIVANSSSGGDVINKETISSNNNLVEDGSLEGAISGDPKLGGLTDNGGPTLTYALLQGSIAINAGNNANVTTGTDQRGATRIVDGIVDIGAFEVQVSIPLPQLSVSNSVAVIDDPKVSSNAVFTVTLNTPSATPVTVQYSTQDNSAGAGADYIAVSGTLTFNPNETVATITVPIISDTNVEPAETFFLNLSNPSNATIAVPQGSATILTFDPAQYGASHGDLIEFYGYDLVGLTNHYLTDGINKREPDRFDELRYIASSYVGGGDMITVFGNQPNLGQIDIEGATKHYITNGYAEKRYLNAFDPARYLNSHDNLFNFYGTNKLEATKHFITNGFKEGYSPDLFPTDRYIASHPDLIKEYRYNLEKGSDHYLFVGRYEPGRGIITFDPVAYRAKYSDVVNDPFYGATLERATQHYIEFGFNENRSPM